MASGQLRMIETAGHFKGLQPFVTQFKNAGAFVIHKCTQVRHAKSAERMCVNNELRFLVVCARCSEWDVRPGAGGNGTQKAATLS